MRYVMVQFVTVYSFAANVNFNSQSSVHHIQEDSIDSLTTYNLGQLFSSQTLLEWFELSLRSQFCHPHFIFFKLSSQIHQRFFFFLS